VPHETNPAEPKELLIVLILVVVARDGIEEHYNILVLSINGVVLDPKLDLTDCVFSTLDRSVMRVQKGAAN
jgi:hypothetical protein